MAGQAVTWHHWGMRGDLTGTRDRRVNGHWVWGAAGDIPASVKWQERSRVAGN